MRLMPFSDVRLPIIEMTDGIEVLVSQSCPTPAIPLLRSSFEALLGIEYVLEADYERRSFAWLVNYIHQRINSYEALDPTYARGKEFGKAVSEDEAARGIELPSFEDLSKAIENLKKLLTKPQYQTTEHEYQQLRKMKRGSPNWYSFFNGPKNLQELSVYLNRGAQYELLYRYWSRITHAGDLSRFLTRGTSGGAIKSFRDGSHIREVAKLAAFYMLESTRKVMGKFRSGETKHIKKWYIAEVRNRFLRL